MFVASLPEVFLCVNSLTVKLASCQEKRKKSAFLRVPGAQCQCCQNKSFMLLCQGQVSHSAPIRCSYMHAEGAGLAWPGRAGSGQAGPGQLHAAVWQQTPPPSLQRTGQKDWTVSAAWLHVRTFARSPLCSVESGSCGMRELFLIY